MTGYVHAYGMCFACGKPFAFNPHLVPSIPIGPDGQPAIGGDRKPISIGLINTDRTQELPVPAQLMPMMNQAAGMAMSVEPAGGSPTGLPTGPILYKGPCTPM